MGSLNNFCRLCLQKITGPFLLINKDPKASDMIKHLFPGMNIDLVEKPQICTECFKNVQFAYTMRETVIKNEEKIKSNLGSIHAIETNTCRFCLNTDESQARVFLYDNAYASMSILETRCVIEIAILNVSLEIFKKPVICKSCWQIVKLIYLFKKRCFATEKILKFYCTENNLISLSCKDLEYISTCFNSNLQKFSKDDQHNIGANLIPKDNIAHAQQGILTSPVNIIRPVDVYLNNFTIEGEDDTSEEDIDDIFVESPRIVKRELSNTSIEDVKIEVVEHNVIFEEKVETEIISADKMEIRINQKNSESGLEKTLPARVEIIEGRSNKPIAFEEKECIPKDGHKIIEYFSSDQKKHQRNLKQINRDNTDKVVAQGSKVKKKSKSNLNKTRKKRGTKKRSVSKKKFEKEPTKLKSISEDSREKKSAPVPVSEIQMYESENLGNIIKLQTLHNNKSNIDGKEEEAIKHIDTKRKMSLKNSPDFEERMIKKNNSQNDQSEPLGTIAKRQKTDSESISESKQRKSDNNNFNQDGPQKDDLEHLKDTGDTTNFNKAEDKHEEMLEHPIKQHINKSGVTIKVKKNCKEAGENRGKGNHKYVVKKPRNQKNSDKEWSCTQCKYKTKHKQHLNRHSLIHIKSPNLLTCPQCIYSTNIQRNLDRHMMKHSSEFCLHCAHCTYSTIYKSHLNIHMRTHERNKSIKESVQREGCRSDEEVVPNNKLDRFRCEDCPFITSKEASFLSHIRTHQTYEKISKCKECHYITTRPHSLQLHMELHKGVVKKNFKCKYCKYTGRRHTDLVSHMLTHQNDFNFSCSECDYKAKRKSHLVTHILRHQSRDQKNMFQCSHCEYKSIRKEHLKSHYRNKHYDKEDDFNEGKVTVEDSENGSPKGQKIVKCPYCLYRQKIGSTLDVHIFTAHFPSDSEQMYCNHCPYKTDKRKRFLKHINYYHPRKDKIKKNKGDFPSQSAVMHCNDCFYKTSHRRLLLQHIFRNH